MMSNILQTPERQLVWELIYGRIKPIPARTVGNIRILKTNLKQNVNANIKPIHRYVILTLIQQQHLCQDEDIKRYRPKIETPVDLQKNTNENK